MKYIELTQNKRTKVDDGDFEMLKKWKWAAAFDKKRKTFYAISNRHRWENVKPISIKMARIILDCPKGFIVDHINHDTLDNRRSNLRVCSIAENTYNRKIDKSNTSGYKGVSKCTALCRYYSRDYFQAQIRVNNKLITLAYGEDRDKLAEIYNTAAVKYFGQFACLNVVK